MGSQLNDLSDILKGGEGQSPAKGATSAAARASGLNQLSDAAEKIEVVKPVTADHDDAAAMPPPSIAALLPSQGMSQEQLIDAPQPMQFQQPSQPDIPPPIMPESQNASQPLQFNAEETKNILGNAGLSMDPNSLMNTNNLMQNVLSNMGLGNLNPMGLNLESMGLYPYGLAGLAGSEDDGQTTGSGRGKGKKQTRRGPMDEMRQLIRILVKIFPHSIALVGTNEESGGGNRISEEQIKSYLEKTLGEAPRPAWGVPNGWNGFLAEVFSWATGKVVTGEECKRVAKREPGRSWESIEAELHALGVHPSCWTLPLTLSGVQEAEKKPVPIEVPVVPTAKRGSAQEEGGAAGAGGGGSAAPSGKRARSAAERDFNKMEEEALWKVINDALNVASNKSGSGADQGSILALKLQAKNKFDDLLSAPATLNQMYQYMPINVPGLSEANLMNLVSNLDDPNAAATIAAAMAGHMPIDQAATAAMAGHMPIDQAATAAAAAVGTALQQQSSSSPPPAKRQRHLQGEGDGDHAEEYDHHMGGNAAAQGEGGGARPIVLGSFGGEGGRTAAAAAAAAAASGQLGSLPMQPPPLNVTNFTANGFAAYMQNMAIPNLNVNRNTSLTTNGGGGNGGGGEEHQEQQQHQQQRQEERQHQQ